MRGRNPAPLKEYLTDQLTREGIEFIKRHKDQPFFLYLAHYAPHTPLQVTDKYYQRFPQIKNEPERIYAAMISALDDGIGAVMDTLEKEGLLENTLVIFASDNGAAQYNDFDGRRNYPLTGHKRNLYEGGIRIPFAVQWRGVLPTGKVYEKPISSLDIFPTALAAAGVAGIDGHDLDGTNLLPYLKGNNNGDPHEYLFWRSGPNAVVRKGKWKLLMAGEDLTRLYDLDNDLSETKDLSAKVPELVAEMKKAFAKWNEHMAEPREAARTVDTDFGGDTIKWHI
jgi:arylsulfatase A-like enzyme